MSVRALAPAVLAAALAFTASARAEDPAAPKKLRIALDTLRTTGVAVALGSLVEDQVCAALGDAARADVVCPADVAAAAALAKSAMAFGECQSDDCLRRLDAFQSTDRRVSGALERTDKGVVLTLQLAGPAGSGPRVVERLPEELDALVARIPAIVQKLFPEK
jgi:hypothetical protein